MTACDSCRCFNNTSEDSKVTFAVAEVQSQVRTGRIVKLPEGVITDQISLALH